MTRYQHVMKRTQPIVNKANWWRYRCI